MRKSDNDQLVTKGMLKETLNKALTEAVDAILIGMDNIIKSMATKEDLKELATKEELKRETGFIRDDIKGLEGELSNTVSKKEFNKLKLKVDKYIHD